MGKPVVEMAQAPAAQVDARERGLDAGRIASQKFNGGAEVMG